VLVKPDELAATLGSIRGFGDSQGASEDEPDSAREG